MSKLTKLFRLSACAGIALGTSVTAAKGECEKPLIWSWAEPLGTHAPDYVTGVVRVKIYKSGNVGMTGAEAAEAVCDAIQARIIGGETLTGKVSVLLHDFGLGDVPAPSGGCPPASDPHGVLARQCWAASYVDGVALSYHEDDALLSSSNDYDYYRTPWMSNGIAETEAWVDDFITEYQARQTAATGTGLDPHIPDPARFHMDTELFVTSCCSASWVELFDAITNDARWDTEEVPGNLIEGMPATLEELYIDAGSPEYCPMHCIPPYCGSGVNVDWSKWYARVCVQAAEGAMEESLYDPVRVAWEGCLTSDYWHSCRTDGQNGNAIRDYNAPGATWATHDWAGLGDFQTPVMYTNVGYVHADHYSGTGETAFQASLRVFRGNVHACVNSFGGGHEDELAPWVSLVEQYFDKDETRCILAMLKSQGVSELIIWNNHGDTGVQNSTNWNTMAELIDQVWGTSLESVAIDFSGSTSDSVVDVQRDEATDFVVTANTAGKTNKTVTRFQFDTCFDSVPDGFRIEMETHANHYVGANEEVDIYNYDSSSWVAVDSRSTTQYPTRRANLFVPTSPAVASDFISTSGEMQVRVTHTSLLHPEFNPLISHYDYVQIVGIDSGAAFRPRSHSETIATAKAVSSLLGADYRTSALATGEGDINRDGKVNIHDLVALFAE